ncbi:MAG: 3-oxoacyl-[acyl-carrier-protein] synthase III C-terminal domain-containing protein, partial [Dehalococcoidales bacterium]|nr:3-oxoacyl-[acyl-carrier-protein] synthase III C-terminal domain-containing protein [Dehalococcoidales bacterium]
MIGILSCGAYVPWHRLSRAEVARAWGGPPGRGEKAVANFDEDSVTMAVAACRDCISGMDSKTIDSVYFASTTFPYKEKQSASVIAMGVDINSCAFTLDLASTMRGGASGVKIAMDAVKSKTAKNALVCAADIRLSWPNSAKEMEFGDGAGALLIGDGEPIATIDNAYSAFNEMIDVYRSQADTYVQSSEERFVREKGYTRVITETVKAALAAFKTTPKNYTKIVCNVPNAGLLTSIVKGLGFDPKTQVQSVIGDSVGNTGAALSVMLLVEALENAKAGDKLLWVTYGDGCDIYSITVTDKIGKIAGKRGIKKHLAAKRMIPTYEKYLRWRDILISEPPSRPPQDRPSAVALWRDNLGGLSLYGVKCNKCGAPQYPAQRVCMICHSKDDFSLYRFADKPAKVTTFSQDNLAAS